MEILTKRYFYLYIIRDSVTGCTYLGQRASKRRPDEDTGYWGSGNIIRMIRRKHGMAYLKGRCSKEILFDHYQSKDELGAAEKMWISVYWEYGMSGWNLSPGTRITNNNDLKVPFEVRSERALRAASTLTKQQRIDKAVKANSQLTNEQKSARSRKSMETFKLTKPCKPAVDHTYLTKKERSDRIREGMAKIPKETKSTLAKIGHNSLTKEQRSERSKLANNSLSYEQRVARSKKAAETTKRNRTK